MSHNISLPETIERREGLVLYPYAANAVMSFTASGSRWLRFVPPRAITVTRIGFRVTQPAAGGTNAGADPIQLGIYTVSANNQTSTTGSSWLRVATTGTASLTTLPSTGGSATNVASAGMKWGALTASYTLTPGLIHYVGISYAYPTAANTTNCQIAAMTDNFFDVFGASIGNASSANGVLSTLATSMSGATSFTSTAPMFALSTLT